MFTSPGHPSPLPSRERGSAVSPSPWDPLLISPWEGEGDGSRERGFGLDWRVLCFSLGSRLRGNDGRVSEPQITQIFADGL